MYLCPMETKTLWMVSNISAFLGEGVDTTGTNHISWFTDKGEIVVKENDLEVQFVDCTLDMKSYFAIVGLAHSNGYTTGDYFTK